MSSALFGIEPFTYSGYVYITVTSKKHNNKRIELNAKNLRILPKDVSVYRSVFLTNLDFDDDPDWNSKEIKYITVQRSKRSASLEETTTTPTTTKTPEEEVLQNHGGEEYDKDLNHTEDYHNETDYMEILKTISEEINYKQYYYPVLPPDDFISIRVIG
jgi:hypothetical protein